jgi:hypothetical protein
MAGVFACPECGQELAVEGLSPGREILCDACSTWVEVPYLPRAGDSRRVRRPTQRSPWNSTLLKGAITFAVVAILGLIAIRIISSRAHSDQEKVLANLIASADKAEADHDYGVAIREILAALAHAQTMNLKDSARFDELKERHDRIIVREVEDRLTAVDALEPDQAVGEAMTLAVKAGQSPALASLVEAIDAKLASLRLRQVEADHASARKAFDGGRDVEAFAAAERLHDHACELSSRSDASRFQADARSILEGAVARKGVALPPVVGRFVAGSAEAYTKVLDRSRAEALRAKGYLPEPRKSAWSTLWDEKAPFRATVQMIETQDDLYLQSKNRMTKVDGTFELLRGDRSIWKNRIVARTREPLPDLPALLGGHLATSDKRNPETERRLHDDAMKQFVELTGKILRGMPASDAAVRVP